ncbi:DUF4160 domain-containing protein [bacterium]|nr:DUF4160 domain-containing protein [bacterium]
MYPHDHAPVHVHIVYNEYESKIELIYEKGKLCNIVIKKVKGKKPIPKYKHSELRKFVKKYNKNISEKWMMFQVYGKKPKYERITKKIL